MLNTMRSIASGFIAKALLAFLVITFGVWGIGDIFRSGGGATYAARVGDTTISIGEFEHSKSLLARQMQAMGIQGADANKLSVGILRQLVQQQLILQATNDLGLAVNDTLLAQSLKVLPQFQNLDGSFSAVAFKKSLSDLHMSEAQFLAQLRNETAGKFLLASLDMSDITPPPALVTLATAAGSETRDIVLISVPATRSTTDPKESDIKEYYEQHKFTDYMETERRKLEYMTLSEADINVLIDKAITPEMRASAEKSLANSPKQNIENYLRAQVRDQVINKLGNAIEDNIAAGWPLGEAIARANVKATSQILAKVAEADAKTEKNDVIATVIQQGFKLDSHEASGIIRSPSGVTLVVFVHDIYLSQPKSLEAVRADIKLRLLDKDAREAANKKATDVQEALKLDNWKDVVARMHVATTTVNNLQRPADGASSNTVVPLALQQAVFEHDIGKMAGPLALANGDQMLAVVLASHHNAVTLSASAQEKATRHIADGVNQHVQASAFTLFAERHKVDVNPMVLRNSSNSDEQ